MSRFNWIPKPLPPDAIWTHIKHAFDKPLPDYLAQLIAQRGLETAEEIKAFFTCSKEQLHDPFLMKGMQTAVDRLVKLREQGGKVLVYGDYDVDGTTAVALMCRFFKTIGIDFLYYLPDRYLEGYGLSLQGVQFAKDQHCEVIVALDCGIKANEQAKYAKEVGIDLIVCDHHLPGEVLPDALAVLDPKQPGCAYPYKELTGNGIGFKLCQAMMQALNLPHEMWYQWLDLVVVSIAADIVPVTGENRVLATLGLQKLNEKPLPGIKAILEKSAFKKALTISDVVFQIGPRINAAGRMGHGSEAVALLLSDDVEEVTTLADQMELRNTERKTADKQITREALEQMKAGEQWQQQMSTVVVGPTWHKGVVGIVASRLTEVHYRPTVVLCENQGKLTGSARSVSDFNLYEALEACSDVLEQFGGHHFAAGLSLYPSKLDQFKQLFETVVAERIKPHQLIPVLPYDLVVSLDQFSPAFFRNIMRLGPFGPGNLEPIFRINHITNVGYPRIVGEHHLSFRVGGLKAIAFNQGDALAWLEQGMPIDLLAHIELDQYKGKEYLQLRVKDIKRSETVSPV